MGELIAGFWDFGLGRRTKIAAERWKGSSGLSKSEKSAER